MQWWIVVEHTNFLWSLRVPALCRSRRQVTTLPTITPTLQASRLFFTFPSPEWLFCPKQLNRDLNMLILLCNEPNFSIAAPRTLYAPRSQTQAKAIHTKLSCGRRVRINIMKFSSLTPYTVRKPSGCLAVRHLAASLLSLTHFKTPHSDVRRFEWR